MEDVESWERRRRNRINPTALLVSKKSQMASRLPSFKPLALLLPASPTYLSAPRTFPTLPAKLKWKRSQSRNDWGGFSLIKLERPNVPFKGNCLPCSCMQTTTSNVRGEIAIELCPYSAELSRPWRWETKASLPLRSTFPGSFQKCADFTNSEQSTETSSIELAILGRRECGVGGNSPSKPARRQ